MTIDAHITDPSLASVIETSRAAREQAQTLVDLIAQATAANTTGPIPADALTEISKQQKLLNTNLAHLRGLHRAAHFRARETKSQTAEARHEVDVLHLQLQNLYYEQRHLEGEIAACEGFDHTYQLLPLVPVEDFLAQHPEHADADENELMVARIGHERAEREALEQQRLELQKRKQKLIAENKKRRDDLANLDKDLEKFIDAAKPIQQMFEKVV
ncbi:Fms-interacting protein-domain-containing protein [Chaetomidium leptoderma]|uniref:Fms-interacting protein-domain-containing protein n=1 Tax=Chaetomidium leptoderma TaxID=669021 RepID=A0AAN6VLF3_9PEZI|nr:Fms-interacting protein-domain-containing protein [Chaetomidium leptoderma]